MARSHSENVTKYEPQDRFPSGVQMESIARNDKERCEEAPLLKRGHSYGSIPRMKWKRL